MSAALEPCATASSGLPPLPGAAGGDASLPSLGGSATGCEPQPAAVSDAPAATMPASLRNSLRLQSGIVPQG